MSNYRISVLPTIVIALGGKVNNLMILEIEYYKCDTRLIGKTVEIFDLKRQLLETEKLYDKGTDNFVQLFVRMFHWDIIDTDEHPDYVYDRDTKLLYKPKY